MTTVLPAIHRRRGTAISHLQPGRSTLAPHFGRRCNGPTQHARPAHASSDNFKPMSINASLARISPAIGSVDSAATDQTN